MKHLKNKFAKVSPFRLIFSSETDGDGPGYIIQSLTGFVVRLEKNGKEVMTGMINGNDSSLSMISLSSYNEYTKQWDGVVYNFFYGFVRDEYISDFDTIVYL
jgi:hypothetical protein